MEGVKNPEKEQFRMTYVQKWLDNKCFQNVF